MSCEDSGNRFEENLTDNYVLLFGYDVCNFVQDTNGVYTLYIDVDREIQCFPDFPLYGQQTVAESGFQFGGNLTLTLVNDNLVLVVNKAQRIVAWDWFTAIGNQVMLFFCLPESIAESSYYQSFEPLRFSPLLAYPCYSYYRKRKE